MVGKNWMYWQFIYYTPLLLLFIARTQVKERNRENCGLERRSLSLPGSLCIVRRQRQRRRHKSIISMAEWKNIIVLHVRHAFWCNVLTYSAKRRRKIFIFEVLKTTGARSSKSSIHSLSLHENHSYQASESALRPFCTTWSTWNNRKRLNLMQSSLLLWRFPCSYRPSFILLYLRFYIHSGRDRLVGNLKLTLPF